MAYEYQINRETLTSEQSMMFAHSINRDAPWMTPAWPTQERIDAFFQTDFGKAVAMFFAEMDAQTVES